MSVIRASAKALDDLIRKGILPPGRVGREGEGQGDMSKFPPRQIKLERCNRSHQKSENKSNKQWNSKVVCYDFINGKCKHGDKCRFSRDKAVIETHKATNAKNSPLKRCRNDDLEDKLCKCTQASSANSAGIHTDQVWTRARTSTQTSPTSSPRWRWRRHVHAVAGARGHEVKKYNKLKLRLVEIKKKNGRVRRQPHMVRRRDKC